ncbi:MAG: MFS transporter [Candidatus Bathyarchaeota archaeon]|nr:MFS transporter [Candidatus Bathyarchaeota archaeon]
MSDEQKPSLIRKWGGFLQRQENPFKVNILKNLAQSFSVNLTYQYQSIFITALGADPLILGLINSVSGVVNTILSIPAGIIADRVGIKKVLLMTLSIYLLSAIIFGVSYTWETAAIGLTLFAVAFTLDRTVCPMICGSTLDSSERVTGMGICDTLSFSPQLVAPLIAATLMTRFGGMTPQGIRPLYYLQIVGLIIGFIIIYTRFENPRAHGSVGRDVNVFDDLKNVLAEGIMVKKWIMVTMLSSFPWQVMFYIPLFAAEVKGANQFIIGGMGTASTLVLVFLAIPLGHLADTRGRKKIIIIAGSLVTSSYLLLVYAPNDVTLLLSGFLSGFAMTVGQIQTAVGAELIPRKYLGNWYGILGFFRGLVNIVSPIICGFLWNTVSPHSVFFMLALMQLISLGVLSSVPTSITK